MERTDQSLGFVQIKTLDSSRDASFQLRNGDRLEIREVSESNRAAVSVSGEAEYAGFYEWKEGLRISDVLKSISFLKQEADPHYALIKRQSLTGEVTILNFSPDKVLKSPNSVADLPLLERDNLILLSRVDEFKRARAIRPLLEELRQEGKPGIGIPTVRILGMVHFPGE